jgi:hypothetical protein
MKTISKTAALNMNIQGNVERDFLTKTAQAPADRRMSLKQSDTKRPLHSAPHDKSSACSAALKLAPRDGKKPKNILALKKNPI